jgi:hypothetical protein
LSSGKSEIPRAAKVENEVLPIFLSCWTSSDQASPGVDAYAAGRTGVHTGFRVKITLVQSAAGNGDEKYGEEDFFQNVHLCALKANSLRF